MTNDTETWAPSYEKGRYGGWYVTNVRYPNGAVGCEQQLRGRQVAHRLSGQPNALPVTRRRRAGRTGAGLYQSRAAAIPNASPNGA
jgi:hypothetical protein